MSYTLLSLYLLAYTIILPFFYDILLAIGISSKIITTPTTATHPTRVYNNIPIPNKLIGNTIAYNKIINLISIILMSFDNKLVILPN